MAVVVDFGCDDLVVTFHRGAAARLPFLECLMSEFAAGAS